MKKPIVIGEKIFKTKKEALLFYREILNGYNFDEVLNEKDFKFLINLIEYNESFHESSLNTELTEGDNGNEEEEFIISSIKIGRAQYNTKCFELVWNDGFTEFISFIQIINRHKVTKGNLFIIACRNEIQNDLQKVKQKYFDENSKLGMVRCQETNNLSKWEELVVDHRQPNTFSMIVDRFKEISFIEIENIDYKIDDNNRLVFEDSLLSEKFINYHKEKATLRIVRKELNLSRTNMAKVQIQNKDLRIE